jgi:hypothetical protein
MEVAAGHWQAFSSFSNYWLAKPKPEAQSSGFFTSIFTPTFLSHFDEKVKYATHNCNNSGVRCSEWRLVMTITANVTLDKKNFIAELNNGGHVAESDLRLLAEALQEAGVVAKDITFNRRDGHRLLTAGQQVALAAAIRQVERHPIGAALAA